MSGDFLEVATAITIVVLIVSGALSLLRIVRGPTLLDRVVALDLLAVLVVSMIAVVAIQTNQPALIDAALAFALVGFVGTIAFAHFIEERGPEDRE